MWIDLFATADDAGKRLDRFLQEQCPDFSRSQLQKAIRDNLITLNGKTVTVHHFLKVGDHVTGSFDATAALTCTPNSTLHIPIIAETETYLVINKPSGITVHQADGHREPDTVANWLVAHQPSVAVVGDDPLRPGIVHRLDADVSGVMIIAKTQPMFEHLKRAFAGRSIEKHYTALVYGTMENAEGTITFPIARSETKEGKMAARPKKENRELIIEDREEKDAITAYTVVKQFQQYALLDVQPKTGRTHQIRVHLFASGHPIVGDPLYQPKEKRKPIVDRIFLHATSLMFKDIDGTSRTYNAPLPAELQSTLDRIH